VSNPLSRRRFVTVTAKSAAVALGGYLMVETAMASASEQHRPTLDTVISAAREAMGEPNTIRYAGRGRNGFYGQTLTAVEFPRYTAVIEAPTDEARSLAVIDAIHTLIPSKPIRYVVTTHHHFDHIGGLRTYVAQGATVVTHTSNVPFLSRSLVAPATIRPDAQSVAARRPRFEPVTDKRVLKQGDRAIEIYSTRGDNHTNELLVAYLPAEGILMEADSYSPAPPGSGSATGYPPPPNALALWDNIRRLGLDVRTIVAAHGSGPVTMADFAAFLGK
jgi:glyoxylase-like metal-dependent hydrolase (beta-lactamase superfamily II)